MAQQMQGAFNDFYPRSPRGERRHNGSGSSYHHHFYPRSPRGERPSSSISFFNALEFLSTLPARGATSLTCPRASSNPFLSTLPARGATSTSSPSFSDYIYISIHAPREGSDPRTRSGWLHPPHFYPRSPRGERPPTLPCRPRLAYFYPRSPRGERPAGWQIKEANKIFLSTLPARGATHYLQNKRRRTEISIHAPREGSDGFHRGVQRLVILISIHAPREGSDG